MSTLSVRNIQGIASYSNTIAIPAGHTLSFDGNLKIPTWTTTGRPASPVTGITGYNTTLGYVEYYDGTGWFSVGTSGKTDGSTAAKAAPTTAALRSAGVTTSGYYHMIIGGNTVQVYVAMGRKVSKDWILVARYPSGGYSVSGAGGTWASFDRPNIGSGSSLTSYASSSQQNGPTLSNPGNLNMRAAYLPSSFFNFIMTEVDYAGTEYWNAFPSSGRNFEASGTSATFFTETPIGRSNTYDATIQWNAELGSLSGWRSSHYACGSGVSAPDIQYSGFGVCRTGVSDSGGNNSGSINTISLWQNTAYINSYPQSSGTEYGSEWRLWIAQ